MRVKAILVKNQTDIEILEINVDSTNYLLIKEKLKAEKIKIINFIKDYKKAGLIKSIFCPKNKTIQKQLNELVKAKRTATKSIKSINTIFR